MYHSIHSSTNFLNSVFRVLEKSVFVAALTCVSIAVYDYKYITIFRFDGIKSNDCLVHGPWSRRQQSVCLYRLLFR